MRIVICMPTLCPWSRSLALTLQQEGHEVHVFDIVRRVERGLVSNKIPGVLKDFELLKNAVSGVHYSRSRLHHRLQYFTAALELRFLCRLLRIDVVLTLSGAGYYTMAYLSGVRPFAAYVVGSDVLLAGRLQRIINKAVLSSACVVLANGDYLAEQTRLQVPKARVVPLLLGINLEKFRLTNFETKPIRLVCTRGFGHVYSNETIVRALSRIPAGLPEFRMIFVSGGELLLDCMNLADNIIPRDIRSRIEFWGGVSYQEVVSCLEQSHIFLSMSLSDGTATALLEAMACGLFPIVSDIPQNRPFVQANVGNGVLIPVGDHGALALAIADAIQRIYELATFAPYNRQRIAELADASKTRQILISILEEVVNGGYRN